MARVRIGEILMKQGRIDGSQLASALAHQRRWGGRLGRAIVHLGFMREEALLQAIGQQLGVPFVEIGDRFVPRHVLALVPEKLIRGRRILPLARLSENKRGPVVVALADPTDLNAIDEIAFATGMQVKPVLAAEPDLEAAIARLLDGALPVPRHGFKDRKDAIDLPEDTNPLSALRKDEDGTKHTFH